jgi:hypothetical protein
MRAEASGFSIIIIANGSPSFGNPIALDYYSLRRACSFLIDVHAVDPDLEQERLTFSSFYHIITHAIHFRLVFSMKRNIILSLM